MALSCRRLIRASIDDLKIQRKASEASRTASEASEEARRDMMEHKSDEQFENPVFYESELRSPSTPQVPEKKRLPSGKDRWKAKAMIVAVAAVVRVDDNMETTESGHALEVLQVMCNCCRLGHTNFQSYMANQANHEDKHDLVTAVVMLLNHLERDLKTVVQDSDDVLGSKASSFKARAHKTLDRAQAAFRLLQYLASGPHRANQLGIAQTDVISVSSPPLGSCHPKACSANIVARSRCRSSTASCRSRRGSWCGQARERRREKSMCPSSRTAEIVCSWTSESRTGQCHRASLSTKW